MAGRALRATEAILAFFLSGLGAEKEKGRLPHGPRGLREGLLGLMLSAFPVGIWEVSGRQMVESVITQGQRG